MSAKNDEKTVGAVAKSSSSLSKAHPPKPIVIDDSETEDDSEDEIISAGRSGNTARKAGPSAGPAIVTRKGQTFEPIMVEDDSDVEETIVKKSALSNLASLGNAVPPPSTASAHSVSLGKRKDSEIDPTVSSSQNGPLGSLPNRAQMEAERLARRKRMLEDDERSGDSKRQRTSGGTTAKSPLASRMFYDGAFFPTATLHANPRADGREAIRFADIIGPTNSDLKLAIISSFGLQPEWLAPHFNPDVPIIVVTATGREDNGPSMARLFDNSNWIQTCPKVGTGGCMHIKLMALFYKSGRLRVVISTANLLSLDWEDLENCVFIQDVIPNSASSVVGSSLGAEKTKESNGASKPEERFEMILETVLKAMNVGPALESVKQRTPELPLKSITNISKLWDWSNVTAELVPSIAGKWEGWRRIKTTGHPRLMRAIETLGLTTSKTQNLVVECQGSSIGTYTTQWFNQFYISASGHSSALKAHMDISEGKRKKLAYPPGVKVVFPTFATVKSTGGHGSTSLFCTRKKWDVKTFPRAAFHDSKSSAGRVLMHTKMIIGSFTQKKNTTAEPSSAAGWMYVGSHNFTSPAWGNLSGSADAPVLNVNNYELGVVIPLLTAEDVNATSAWERPPRKYSADDIPWLQEEHR
ncbi:tyrosyl-DNA phosphodiesterase-domain-containing protein [Mycena capillaripes]|nr:tyrosyl-DNA phosphodiesterase-domain-containing protein [Mycena capillaripes]